MARALVCLDNPAPTDGTCAVSEFQEIPSSLPPLTKEEAVEIAGSLLIALAAVMAVKVAFRKSQ